MIVFYSDMQVLQSRVPETHRRQTQQTASPFFRNDLVLNIIYLMRLTDSYCTGHSRPDEIISTAAVRYMWGVPNMIIQRTNIKMLLFPI